MATIHQKCHKGIHKIENLFKTNCYWFDKKNNNKTKSLSGSKFLKGNILNLIKTGYQIIRVNIEDNGETLETLPQY